MSIEHPHRRLAPIGIGEHLGTSSLQCGDDLGDHVTVAAQHRTVRERRHEFEGTFESKSFGQSIVVFDHEIEVSRQRLDRLTAPNEWTRNELEAAMGCHELGDSLAHSLSLSPPLLGERTVAIVAVPLRTITGFGVSDQEERVGHGGKISGVRRRDSNAVGSDFRVWDSSSAIVKRR